MQMQYPSDIMFNDPLLVQRLAENAALAEPYCPYSGYKVRAAVAARYGSGIRIYWGANYEVVSFNQTMHAEHSAITAALNDRVPQFGPQIIEAVYVETKDGGMPCGHCRQIIAEFAVSPSIPIYVSNGKDWQMKTLAELLPYTFNADSLDA